jgi:acyl-CoA thioesterase I
MIFLFRSRLFGFVIMLVVALLADAEAEGFSIFGNATRMEKESLFFYQKNKEQPAESHLLFPASSIVRLTDRVGEVVYEEGKDYILGEDRVTIQLPTGSRIPFHTPADMYLAEKSEGSIAHKLGDPGVWLRYAGTFFQRQSAVTYDHEPQVWQGYLPMLAEDVLPKTFSKLKNRESITIGVTGDSISAGCDSTSMYHLPPFTPPYIEQVVEGLRKYYGADVKPKNRAVGGWVSGQGLEALPTLLADKPDLIIIAYGMNDVGQNNPEGYKETIRSMLKKIRKELPDTEVILISTMRGNPEWVHTPENRFVEYQKALKSLTGAGVAWVNMTAVWEELLKHKTFWDITGNGVNHPNDFGHRIYAEMILRLFIPE